MAGVHTGKQRKPQNIGSIQRILSNRAVLSLEKFERQGGAYIILLD